MIFGPIVVLVLSPSGKTNESDNHGISKDLRCPVTVSSSVGRICAPLLQSEVTALSWVAVLWSLAWFAVECSAVKPSWWNSLWTLFALFLVIFVQVCPLSDAIVFNKLTFEPWKWRNQQYLIGHCVLPRPESAVWREIRGLGDLDNERSVWHQARGQELEDEYWSLCRLHGHHYGIL